MFSGVRIPAKIAWGHKIVYFKTYTSFRLIDVNIFVVYVFTGKHTDGYRYSNF
jgi:hypothetical protein